MQNNDPAPADYRQRPLYMSSGCKPAPVTYGRLVEVMWETIQALAGCISLVKDLEEKEDVPYEAGGALIMLRATMEHLNDLLFTVQPNEDGAEVPQ